jgi:hypothetical protein
MKFRVFWGVAPCNVVGVDRRFRGAYCIITAQMMEAVCTSETWVYSNETARCYTPQDPKLHVVSMIIDLYRH